MKWIFCVPLEILATVIAYITNPIVCLFADERGNLPRLFYWWQTYDNCLDIDWLIYEHCVPWNIQGRGDGDITVCSGMLYVFYVVYSLGKSCIGLRLFR